MHEHASARAAVEAMIRSKDLEGLLRHAESMHGHRCPFLALGVKAGQYAMDYLDQENTGMEEVVAVVECNNCFTDGIQVVTGCTFGNNALIYKDLGKTAVTVARRIDGAAVRLVVHPDFRERMFARYPAAGPLFEKVVVQRQGTAGGSPPLPPPVGGRGPAGTGRSGPVGAVPDRDPHHPHAGVCPDFCHGGLRPLRRRGDGAPDQGARGPEGLSGLRRRGILLPHRPGDRLQPGDLKPAWELFAPSPDGSLGDGIFLPELLSTIVGADLRVRLDRLAVEV